MINNENDWSQRDIIYFKKRKKPNTVRWITQTGDFNTKYTSKVENLLTEFNEE